jgi:hypothetical protein
MAQEPSLQERLRALACEVERQSLRPIAKASASRVERLRSEDHAEFVEVMTKLERYGVTHSDFARYIERDRSRVSNWFLYGYTERCQIPAYVLRAAGQLLNETLCAVPRNGSHG